MIRDDVYWEMLPWRSSRSVAEDKNNAREICSYAISFRNFCEHPCQTDKLWLIRHIAYGSDVSKRLWIPQEYAGSEKSLMMKVRNRNLLFRRRFLKFSNIGELYFAVFLAHDDSSTLKNTAFRPYVRTLNKSCFNRGRNVAA